MSSLGSNHVREALKRIRGSKNSDCISWDLLLMVWERRLTISMLGVRTLFLFLFLVKWACISERLDDLDILSPSGTGWLFFWAFYFLLKLGRKKVFEALSLHHITYFLRPVFIAEHISSLETLLRSNMLFLRALKRHESCIKVRLFQLARNGLCQSDRFGGRVKALSFLYALAQITLLVMLRACSRLRRRFLHCHYFFVSF